MRLIYEIIRKLKPHELRRVRSMLSSSPYEHEKAEKLLELVLQHPEREEDFYAKKLYGVEADNTFRVAKSRLKRILENALLHDKSLNDYETEAVNARLQTRKRLLQGEILAGRGALQSSQHLLYQVLSESRKYGFVEEEFQADLLMYRILSVRTSVTEYEKQRQELLGLNGKRALISEALILHYSIKNLLMSLTPDAVRLERLREDVERIRVISELTGAGAVEHVYLLTEIFYLQVVDRYEEAYVFCQTYLSLLKGNRAQFSEKAIAGGYVHLMQVALQLGLLEEARGYVPEILSRYAPEDINYMAGLELGFRVAFYGGDYAAADGYVAGGVSHPEFLSSKMRAAKWQYLSACLALRTGRPRDALRALNLAAPLLLDKQGMNLHVRLVEIMALYEAGVLDVLEARIVSLRQFVKRTQGEQGLFRPRQLVQLVLLWHRHRFEFGSTLLAGAELLDGLAGYHASSPFKTSDFELVRFEHWLVGKGSVG